MFFSNFSFVVRPVRCVYGVFERFQNTKCCNILVEYYHKTLITAIHFVCVNLFVVNEKSANGTITFSSILSKNKLLYIAEKFLLS